jgi:hypothetical protein
VERLLTLAASCYPDWLPNCIHRLLGIRVIMAKPHRKLKKANHGKRPANAKAKKGKRKLIRT